MKINMTGLDVFQKSLRLCTLDKSSLSIGRVSIFYFCKKSLNVYISFQHEELVLLLIELRRDQNKLERLRDHYRELLSLHRPHEKEYKRK